MARHRENRNEPVAAPAQPKGFKNVNPNAAGSDEHYVAVPKTATCSRCVASAPSPPI